MIQNQTNVSDEIKTKIIRKEVLAAGREFRAKYPILQYQNAIGFTIFAVSVVMIILSAIFYLQGKIPAWVVILSVAFWTSLLHEIEHDLIHYMYFKENPFVQNSMLLVGWLLRPMTVNPWWRRHAHFHHHLMSGTKTDIEERAVTNGEKWGFRRLFTVGDLFLGSILRAYRVHNDVGNARKNGDISKELTAIFKKMGRYSMLPFTVLLYFVWYWFVGYHLLHFVAKFASISIETSAFMQAQLKWINPLVVILIAPNLLRMFCLHFITSNMHYYGDVDAGNVMQQTQVLDKWYFIPFQIFCCNFGGTHAIHHFFVNETFYIRQFTAARAHKIMREQGVRFNDLASFTRANRYHAAEGNIQ